MFSDGLRDNLHDHEVVSLVNRALPPPYAVGGPRVPLGPHDALWQGSRGAPGPLHPTRDDRQEPGPGSTGTFH